MLLRRRRRAGARGAWGGHPPSRGIGLASLPGDGAAPRVFLAAAGLVAWSLLLLAITSTWVATYTAIIAISATAAIAAAVRMLAHLPYLSLGCGVLAISLLVALNAPTASAVWARFPLPNVPAPGEPTPPPSSLTEIEDLPEDRHQRVLPKRPDRRLGDPGGTRVGAGAVVAGCAGAACLVADDRHDHRHDAADAHLGFGDSRDVVLGHTVSDRAGTDYLVYRDRSPTGRTVRGRGRRGPTVVCSSCRSSARELTIPQRRYLDLFENALLITILPAMLWLVGLVSLIRNLGAI